MAPCERDSQARARRSSRPERGKWRSAGAALNTGPCRPQVIVLHGQRSIGRLVNPQVELQAVAEARAAGSDIQLRLSYECWQPAARPAAPVPTDVRIIINDICPSSCVSLKLIGRWHGASFVYPVVHSVSGRDLAAAASLHLQQLDYIEQQRAKHQSQKPEAAPLEQQRVPRHHFNVQIGKLSAPFRAPPA